MRFQLLDPMPALELCEWFGDLLATYRGRRASLVRIDGISFVGNEANEYPIGVPLESVNQAKDDVPFPSITLTVWSSATRMINITVDPDEMVTVALETP